MDLDNFVVLVIEFTKLYYVYSEENLSNNKIKKIKFKNLINPN